ncbi:MAG: hypothetical protein KKH88_03080 [Nanoarchaeota archaeon]|nr:hypothetical protein [Nanoarchaeota archaeon]
MKTKKRKGYPDYWTDFIAEMFCMARSMSKKKWVGIQYEDLRDLGREKPKGKVTKTITKNKDYIPLSKKNKNCKKKLGWDCLLPKRCPFLALSEPTDELIKHVEKFYNKKSNN